MLHTLSLKYHYIYAIPSLKKYIQKITFLTLSAYTVAYNYCLHCKETNVVLLHICYMFNDSVDVSCYFPGNFNLNSPEMFPRPGRPGNAVDSPTDFWESWYKNKTITQLRAELRSPQGL